MRTPVTVGFCISNGLKRPSLGEWPVQEQHGKDPETEELETAGMMTWHNVGVSSYHNEHHVDFVWTTVATFFVRNYLLNTFLNCGTHQSSRNTIHEMKWNHSLTFSARWGLFKSLRSIIFVLLLEINMIKKKKICVTTLKNPGLKCFLSEILSAVCGYLIFVIQKPKTQ